MIGFNQEVHRNNNIDNNGYWSAPIKNYGDWQILFLDKHFVPIPYSCHLNGHDGYDVEVNKLSVLDYKKG